LPEPVRRRIERNLLDNTQRCARLQKDIFEICDALEAASASYVILKGLTQWPRYVSDPRLRVQYDLDLFCPPDSIDDARDAVLRLGYDPVEGFEEFPIDHLPTLIRKGSFRWRGNYFDPEAPMSVDIHFRYWDEDTERIAVPGLDCFWSRRTGHAVDGRTVPALHPADALAYASLHFLRHVLRGSLRLCHAYELAYFLHASAGDGAFWAEWRSLHKPGLRSLEAVAFHFAASWFSCCVAPEAEDEIRQLPDDVRSWFEDYAASPVESLFRPNKNELWLHLSLLGADGDKRSVLLRRLLPSRLPTGPGLSHIAESEVTSRMRWSARLAYFRHVCSRAVHHLSALFPALTEGLRWWLRAKAPGAGFWRYLLAASIYHFGVFVFVLLYNLYLLDLGFREGFLGLVTSAFTLGNLAGTLPAGWAAHRFGLKRTVVACIAGVAAASALRCLVVAPPALLATAFLGGLLSSFWFVSVAPAVSGLTSPRHRPLGFSLFFSAGIAVGILGGLAGGRLPGWIQVMSGMSIPAQAKQAALFAGCAISALALLPASKLPLPAALPPQVRIYPRSPFITRFLAALAMWSFAAGWFAPFFTAFFSRHLRASDSQIGLIFSSSQMFQAMAVLLAPLVLRRFGLVGGIVGMQLAAAVALACLVPGPPLLAAAAAYAGFMSFQSMCEPGTYSLLMNHVREEQRSGAAALNFLVAFLMQAASAALAGLSVARFGYPPALAAAAAASVAAALLFRRLMRKFA